MTDILASLLDDVSKEISTRRDGSSEAQFVVSVRKKLEKVKLYLQENPSVFNLILIDPDTLANLHSCNSRLTEMCLTFTELSLEEIREFLHDVNEVVQEFTFPAAVSPAALSEVYCEDSDFLLLDHSVSYVCGRKSVRKSGPSIRRKLRFYRRSLIDVSPLCLTGIPLTT